MGLVARIQELFEDRRCDTRSPVHRPAELLIDGSIKKAILVNLSRTGAMLDAAFPPTEGAVLVLRCAPIEAAARVVWVRRYRLGLRFDQKISARDIAAVARHVED